MDRRRYLRAVGSVATVLAVAGCTRDDAGASPGDSTPAGTDEQTATPGTSPPQTPTATPRGTPPGNPARRVAVGDGLQFDPENFEISVGDTVLWEWLGSGHNVKYDDGDVPADTSWTGTEGSRTTTYDVNHQHRHTFEVAGEYDYYCVPHQSSGMRGGFTVTE